LKISCFLICTKLSHSSHITLAVKRTSKRNIWALCTSSERIFSDSRSPIKLLATQGLPAALLPQVSWRPLQLPLPAQMSVWAFYFATLFLAVPPSTHQGQSTGCKQCSSTWLKVNRLQSEVQMPVQGACWLEIPVLAVPGKKSLSPITDSERQSPDPSLR